MIKLMTIKTMSIEIKSKKVLIYTFIAILLLTQAYGNYKHCK